MKIAVAVPAGLIMGLALGTFAGMMMAPPPDAAAHADSTVAAGDSTTHAEPVADSSPAAPDTTHAAPVDDHAPVAASTTPTPAPAVAMDHSRLARILEKLPGTDGAALVARLTDDELLATLRIMEIGKAAELIAALPKERGGVMGKRLLTPGGSP